MTAKYPSWDKAYRSEYQKRYRAEHAKEKKAKARAYYLANKAKVDARNKSYYERDRQRAIDRAARWVKANRERALASRRANYKAKHEFKLAKGRQYANTRKLTGKAAAYRDANREKQRAWARKRSADAADAYAREQLAKYSPISAKDFPQALVEVKKLQIQIKRQLKTHEKCNPTP